MEQIKVCEGQINRLNDLSIEIRVTDHAILRYLERVKGVDLEKVRKELMPYDVEKQIKMIGFSGIYPVDKSHKLRVKDRTVVTVLTMEMN